MVTSVDTQEAHVSVGPIGKALYNTIPNAIKTFANDGHHLIIDEVITTKEYLTKYTHALHNHTVYFIKVDAPLNIKQKREIERGNRTQGVAKYYHKRAHSHGFAYDFSIDTQSVFTGKSSVHYLKLY